MPVRINGELIILKTVATRQLYKRSKDVYFILKDETFLPTLKYFDDKHLILGLSDVGDAVTIYKYKHPRQYNKLLEKFNNELKNIINKLFDKYGLYHNDLREKNICIDKNNNIRLIDFDRTSTRRHSGENKYFKMW